MQSFKTLYRDHYGFVWSTVRRHGVNPMLVEDAVHDTFVVAYRRLDAFDGRRPKAWLYSIGRRVASSYRRSEDRRDARHKVATESSATPLDVESTVGAKAALDRFLEGLSPDDRELFLLSEVDGLTGPELAATLGRKLPTLYSRVRVLRQRFEKSVGGEAREERPRASAHGWMVLQPWLAAPAAKGSALLIAAALTLVALGGAVGLATTRSPAPARLASLPLPDLRGLFPAPPPEPLRAAPAPSHEPLVEVEPAHTAPEPASIPAKPRPNPSATPPTVEPLPDLAADTGLLREAKAALRNGDAQRAKTLLTQHDTRFPRPAQPDLRVALWVETLCALGRQDDARAKARALLSAHPGTPVAKRIASSCATQP